MKLSRRRPSLPPAGGRPAASKAGLAGPGMNPRTDDGIFSLPPRMMGWLLMFITVLAYLPAFHAGFIWDDDKYVTQNPLLTAPDGLRRIWFSMESPSQYFPLTYTVFRLEQGWWGLIPAGYHCVNILLHGVNALLVWRLLQRLGVPGAWLAAAIFALHPVQVESVAWVTELKNVLSLFFILPALLAWHEFIEGTKPPGRWYALALICHALALTAKTTACTLPAALLLMLWLKHKPVTWLRLAQVIPFLMLSAGMGLLTMWWERYHQGTQGALFSAGWPERILVASHAVWFYLGKLLWPADLMFSYPRWDIHPADPLAYGWLAALAGLGVMIWRLRPLMGRGPEVAALFHVLMLGPLLGFIMLYTFYYTFVADHYQYVACLGPIALAAAGMTRGFERWGKGKRVLPPVFCGILLLTLGILTWRQCGMYASEETLWRRTLQQNPGSWMAHVNLGEYLVRMGRVAEADTQWQEALKLKPDDALAWHDLGVAAAHLGRVEEAVQDYQKALAIDPGLYQTCDKLAWVLATSPIPALRNGPAAVELAQRAARLTNGKNPAVLSTLAAAEASVGHFPEAVAVTRQALQLAVDQADPGPVEALQAQLKFYQANSTFRDLSLTNVTPVQ